MCCDTQINPWITFSNVEFIYLYQMRHSSCHQAPTVMVTPCCTHCSHYTEILYLCSTLFLSFHTTGELLAGYLPVNRALQLDCVTGFDEIQPSSRGRLWAGSAWLAEPVGCPRRVAQGVQGVQPGKVLGKAQGVVGRVLPSHPEQPCSYHESCAAPDRHGEGCSKTDIKEKLLIMKA